jgi:hypothetical protein
VSVDQRTDLASVVVSEDGDDLMHREERCVAFGHQIVNQCKAFAGPDDGEGQEGAEEEGSHAGQRHVHPDVTSLRADEQRCDGHDRAGEHSGKDDDLAVSDR